MSITTFEKCSFPPPPTLPKFQFTKKIKINVGAKDLCRRISCTSSSKSIVKLGA
jgi:hypothetical protein